MTIITVFFALKTNNNGKKKDKSKKEVKISWSHVDKKQEVQE